MSKQDYTDADRATVLAALQMYGGNISKTARVTGFPRNTVAGWRKYLTDEDKAELITAKKVELAVLMRRIADQAAGLIGLGLTAVEESVDDEGNPNAGKVAMRMMADLNRVFGTSVDKLLLLREQPTERVALEVTYVNDWRSVPGE